MKQYIDLLKKILNHGEEREDRTGTGTLSLFGEQMIFDLNEGFPLLTTKALNVKAIIHELIWCLRGDTNIKYLNDNGVHIWDAWADENGDLGDIYGKQWRGGECELKYYEDCLGDAPELPDQISDVIKSIKENPTSRRHMVVSWNPLLLHDMKLPPCHCLFQFYVHNDKRLDCQLYQRSGDVFLGVPFNIASYALLTHLMAKECGLSVGRLLHTFGDVHLYKNHLDQARLQLKRTTRDLPIVKIKKRDPITCETLSIDDIEISYYDPHPHIHAEVSI